MLLVMNKYLPSFFVFVYLLIGQNDALGQTLSLDAGLGIGNVVGKENAHGKINASLSGWFSSGTKFSLGLHLSTGGNFIPGNQIIYEGDTEILSPVDCKWHAIQAKSRYFPWGQERLASVFLGAGMGWNNYFYNLHSVEENRVSQSSWAFSAEMGVKVKFIYGSLNYYKGGRTPTFQGNRPIDYGGNPIRLASEQISMIFLTLGFSVPVIK